MAKKGYLLLIDEIQKLGEHKGNYNFKTEKEELEKEVEKMFEEEKILDGDKLEELFFPTKKYDFFISYSHNDEDVVKNLANYLLNKGFTVFLDSKIWGSADHLLKLIDEEYCKNGERNYDYDKRNFSTSHVHSILNSAIGEAINKSDHIIFTSIEKSSEFISENNEIKILSPWIYQELNYFNLFHYNQRVILENVLGAESARDDIVSKSLKIWRKGDTSKLNRITIEDIKQMSVRNKVSSEFINY
ncbi:MAG: toll/interleukin-1 receptor domain-containing protein [Cetobacterium sp.]|uniref:toll/interleukin-1 receptor domain-containing protein n=1 Tax=Cetobacterium sp. TaxID=2071632 RepID=UPI003F406285